MLSTKNILRIVVLCLAVFIAKSTEAQISGPTYVCEGDQVDYIVGIGGGGGIGAGQYDWSISSSFGILSRCLNCFERTLTVSSSAPNSATLTVTYTEGSYTETHSKQIYIYKAGTVSASATTICDGDDAQLSISFQQGESPRWQYKVSGGSWQTDPNFSTTNNYTFSNLNASTQFRVRTQPSCGGNIYSNTVTVSPFPNLSSGSIGGNKTICYNSSAGTLTNSSSASGGSGSYSYQWRKRPDGGSWSNVSGATGSSYSPGNLTTKTYFQRRVYDGCEYRYSNTVTVSVRSPLASGSINGTKTICYNASAGTLGNSSSASGGSGNYTYQWQKKPNGGSWSNISGATSTSYSPGSLTTKTYYRRGVIDNSGCGTQYSNTVTISVYQPLDGGSISSVNGTSITCSTLNDLTQSEASGGSGSVSYQWQSRTTGGWSNIPATNANYPLPVIQQNTDYRRVATDNNGCGVAYTNVLSFDVQLDGGSISTTQVLCAGSNPSAITSNDGACGENGAYSYQWQVRDPGGSWNDISAATSETYDPGVLNSTKEYRRKVTSNGSTAYSTETTITINPPSEGGIVSGAVAEFGASSGTLTLSGHTGSVLKWQENVDGSGWNDISNNTTSLSYSNVTESTQYQAIVRNGACVSDVSEIAEVTIHDVPSITINGSDYIAPGASTMLETDAGFYSYQWKKDGVDVNGATSSTITITKPGNYKVTVKPSSGGTAYTTGEYVIGRIAETQDNMNYVTSIDYLTSGVTESTDIYDLQSDDYAYSKNYVDGAGRAIQSVMLGGSPQGNDVITPIEYDDYGRVVKEYLPYVNEERKGVYTASAKTDQGDFYENAINIANDDFPYAQRVYESAPLNRVIEQGAPGAAWQPGGATVEMAYHVNNSSDNVKSFDVVSTNLVWKTNYDAGNLYKNVTTDEEDHQVIEFINKQGQTILKRVQAHENGASEEWADTYYVYDDYGNLIYVLPPEAVKAIGSPSLPHTLSTTLLAQWAFQYKYDHRNRMIEKRVPGADWVYMIYDDRDRLVLTQDGNQRLEDKWTFTKYDALNRPVITGEKVIGTAVSTLRDLLDGPDWVQNYAAYETLDGSYFGYTSNCLPKNITVDNIHTVTYYDDYSFPHASSYPFEPELGHTAPFITVKGQVTGTLIKVLDGSNTWLEGISYYDDKYRVVQTQSENLLAGVDIVTNKYDFTGKVLETKTTHEGIKGQPVQWTDLVGVELGGENTLTKIDGNGWGNAGAASLNKLPANSNGWVQFIEQNGTTVNNRKMIGLSVINEDAHYNTIDYALHIASSGLVIVWKNGSNIFSKNGYSSGDVFRIERDNSSIIFKQNGTILTTVSCDPSEELIVDASIYHQGASLNDVKVSFNSDSVTVLTKTFAYDHAGRLLQTTHQIDSEPEVIIAVNTYNELGELIDKKLHSEDNGETFEQSIDYKYNIRGWLQSINNANLDDGEGDYFGMEIGYNNDLGIGNNPRYNGDVSGIKWSNNLGLSDIDQRGNTYEYDAMSRLTASNHQYKIGTWQSSTAHSVSSIQYNLNGSPTEIIRKDMLGADLDRLSYVYDGNQPVNITDAGDNDYGFKDGNKHASTGIDDYQFDENGNLEKDENKDIIRYSYNYLNLPDTIELTGGRMIKFIYDAAGIKLAQENYENGQLVKRRDYVGEFFYENDTLQFISHDEGRIVKKLDDSFSYEYTISDKLENGWLSFTTNPDTWVFEAGMESENAADEEAIYSNVAETRSVFNSANHTPGGNEAAELDSSNPIGPAISLHVFPGDTIKVETYAYYEGGSGYSSTASLAGFIAAVAGSYGGVNGGTEAQQATYDAFDNAFSTFGGLGGTGDDNVPAAYLNYILFDKYMNYKASGFKQITSAANSDHEKLTFDDLVMQQEGLIYIYVSYESQNGRAFFDDMTVTHAEGPIVSTNTFFPNGGQIDALSFQRPSSPLNRFKFIDRELVDDYGVEIYDHLARTLDPWWGVGYMQIDPLADQFSSWTSYHYAFSNPMRYIDKTGMAPEDGTECPDGNCDDKKEDKNPSKEELEQALAKAKENGDLITIYSAQDGTANDDVISNAKAALFGAKKTNAPSPGEKLLDYLSKGVATKNVLYETSTTDFQYRGNNFKLSKGISKVGFVGDVLKVGNELVDENYDRAALEALKAAGGSYTTAYELTQFVGETQLPAVTKRQADLAMKFYRMGVATKSEALKQRYFKMAQQFQNQALKMQSHLKRK